MLESFKRHGRCPGCLKKYFCLGTLSPGAAKAGPHPAVRRHRRLCCRYCNFSLSQAISGAAEGPPQHLPDTPSQPEHAFEQREFGSRVGNDAQHISKTYSAFAVVDNPLSAPAGREANPLIRLTKNIGLKTYFSHASV